MIKNYKSFLEARLSDLVNLTSKNDNELFDKIQKFKDMEFDVEKKLVKFITLKKRVNNTKIRFSIDWNDSVSHDLIKRIVNRTSFKSVEEFNTFFIDIINKVFPDQIGKDIYNKGKYAIYHKDYNITIIIAFDIEKYMNEKYEIRVVNILPGRIAKNIINFIDIVE